MRQTGYHSMCGDTADDIRAAAEILQQGEVIAMPTETVYGLAADATSGEAVQKIFAIKNRPPQNPLIIHVADIAAIEAFAELTPIAMTLLEAFAPGPLTVILPQKPDSPITPIATANLSTVAVRIPAHDFAAKLLRALPFPLAAPSANISGYVSPTRASHCSDLPVPIFDGGACHYGLESTVIDATSDMAYLLRAGAITPESIAAVGVSVTDGNTTEGAPISPGQLLRHYATRLPLETDVREPSADDAYIAFGDYDGACFRNLSPTGDLREATRNLYAYLREADASGKRRIAVAPIPTGDLGNGIRERLMKAKRKKQ